MSSLHAKKSIKNVSQLKLQLKTIIQNIQVLEELEQQQEECAKQTIPAVAIIEQTNNLLNQIENQPVEKLAKLVQKHKTKKRERGTKSKGHKIVATQNKKLTTSAKLKQPIANKTVVDIQPTHSLIPAVQNRKLHHQLRSHHDAQRFLRTFELLKMLHSTRSTGGQSVEETQRFTAQFNNLRAIWNNILLENTPQRTQECKIEDQWNEALFGAREKTYYGGAERKMSDLIRIRRIWDSYLTRSSKYGSSIPIGWVLPKKDAHDRWSCYRKE